MMTLFQTHSVTLNMLIVLTGVLCGWYLWRKQRRVLYAVIAIIGGLIWHVIRGYMQHDAGMCSTDDVSNLLVILSLCVPYQDIDIAIAQVGVIAGLSVVVFLVIKANYEETS